MARNQRLSDKSAVFEFLSSCSVHFEEDQRSRVLFQFREKPKTKLLSLCSPDRPRMKDRLIKFPMGTQCSWTVNWGRNNEKNNNNTLFFSIPDLRSRQTHCFQPEVLAGCVTKMFSLYINTKVPATSILKTTFASVLNKIRFKFVLVTQKLHSNFQ